MFGTALLVPEFKTAQVLTGLESHLPAHLPSDLDSASLVRRVHVSGVVHVSERWCYTQFSADIQDSAWDI